MQSADGNLASLNVQFYIYLKLWHSGSSLNVQEVKVHRRSEVKCQRISEFSQLGAERILDYYPVKRKQAIKKEYQNMENR